MRGKSVVSWLPRHFVPFNPHIALLVKVIILTRRYQFSTKGIWIGSFLDYRITKYSYVHCIESTRCKMYTNIIRTNKWLLSNRADPDFDRIDERVTPQKKNANKILNNPPIYRLSNFKLSTGLPWLERARVEQNTWENNDLTKDRVSTSSSLPVDCLTNLTRAQPPTLRSNFQQNGARRERVEGKGYFGRVVGRKKKREEKREENKGEKGGKNGKERTVSWIVFCNAGFQVERRTGKAARSLWRKGGALTTDFPFNRFALRRSRDQKIPDPQLHKCVAGLAFELQWKSIGFIRPGKRLPPFGFLALVFYLSLSLSLSLCFGGPLKRSPVNRGHPLNDQSAACNYVSEATWMCVLRGNICWDVRLNFKFHFDVPI